MAVDADLRVAVCYARPGCEFLRETTVPAGSTVLDAIRTSGVFREAPEIDLDACRVGIYGKIKTLDTIVRTHDRIEIYRALTADPKDSRRARADKKAAGVKVA